MRYLLFIFAAIFPSFIYCQQKADSTALDSLGKKSELRIVTLMSATGYSKPTKESMELFNTGAVDSAYLLSDKRTTGGDGVKYFKVKRQDVVAWVDERHELIRGIIPMSEEYDTRFKDLIKKYGSKNADRILSGKIWIGMTTAMLKDSWGDPAQINRTVTKYSVHEQWVYSKGEGPADYVYVENGQLQHIRCHDKEY